MSWKKIFLLQFLILSGLIYIFFFNNFLNKNKTNPQITSYKIHNRTYKLLIADTPNQWEKGLMYVKKPVDYDGMMFVFPDKTIRVFWNKNTYEDLDLYWIDDEKVLGKIILPSIDKTGEIKIVNSENPVNKVVEIIR